MAGAIAVISTFRVITNTDIVHALLYLIVSLLSTALVFYSLGAPFIAALEVIIYAGAIMVLFVFVIMMLNIGPRSDEERTLMRPGMWIGPAVLSIILMAELGYALVQGAAGGMEITAVISPKMVGIALFGPYLVGVELASFLLLAGIVGVFHIGRRDRDEGGL